MGGGIEISGGADHPNTPPRCGPAAFTCLHSLLPVLLQTWQPRHPPDVYFGWPVNVGCSCYVCMAHPQCPYRCARAGPVWWLLCLHHFLGVPPDSPGRHNKLSGAAGWTHPILNKKGTPLNSNSRLSLRYPTCVRKYILYYFQPVHMIPCANQWRLQRMRTTDEPKSGVTVSGFY